MIIYIDKDYKCHAEFVKGLTPIETDFFDGKCKQFIEGYRYIPENETWTREDGEIISGGTISPHTDYFELEKVQLIYEKELAEQALNIIMGGE